MHILIVGAGLAGVCSAWYLRAAGHSVTVIEREEAPALETSFANGGQISISHPEPWANPGAPMTILRWLGRPDAPLLFRWPAEAARIHWGIQFLRECLPGRTRHNTLAIASLAAYSGNCLRNLRGANELEYEHLSRGILHLYFARENLRHGIAQQKMLTSLGIDARMLSAAECIATEPSLSGVEPLLVGGMFGSGDESGNAQRFATELARQCAEKGVIFHYATHVERLISKAGEITGIEVRHGAHEILHADAYVLTAGSYSAPLMQPLGERLPIYPVKGYSATFPLQDPSLAPSVSLTDESRRIVCSRLGNRLRVAGTAELNGFNTELDSNRCQALLDWTTSFFPGAADTEQPNFWAGLRPTTPSNLPLIGKSRQKNLYYNTGHGTLGWTLACGSAQALAHIVCGREPEVKYPFMNAGWA